MSDTTTGTGPDRSPARRSVERIREGVIDSVLPYASSGALAALEGVTLSRSELRAVAEHTGDVYDFGSSETYTLSPPEYPDRLGGYVAKRVGEHSLERPFVCELPDCTLVGAYPIPLTADRDIVLEATVQPMVLLRNIAGSAKDVVTEPRTVREAVDGKELETACLLFNHWSSGYFHWTFESLTRLEGLEYYAERTGREPTLVLGPDPPDWQVETLELLGYDESDWLEWETTRATVDRFVVPTVRREGVLSPEAVGWLRERVRGRLGEFPVDPDEYPDRVYVSRHDADRRRVRNEREVMDILSDRGFERFVLSELSVPEQAALFAGAEAIVAPHGAGLTNLAYADDPAVVEIFKEDDIRAQYFQLAGILDLEYRYLVGSAVGPDLVVDLEELRDVVESALE